MRHVRRTLRLLLLAAIGFVAASPIASAPTCYACGDLHCTSEQSGYKFCQGGPTGCMAWGICPD